MNVWMLQIKMLYSKHFNLHHLFNELFGGAGEDRTPDPLRARQVLSQLSYDPFFCFGFFRYSALY